MIFSPGHTDKKPDENGTRDAERNSDQSRQPFDTSDLEQIAPPTHDDPPYREWWVIGLP